MNDLATIVAQNRETVRLYNESKDETLRHAAEVAEEANKNINKRYMHKYRRNPARVPSTLYEARGGDPKD
jgi:DNA integrity scanning protein DisA with diadenylate cyclase activity